MIDKSTVEKIIDSAEIVSVIQDFITLKKRGVNYIGNCPFHNEKTPSFTVSPAKGIYKCFGCGAAGNAVKFVMEVEHVSYPEALKHLAKKYHIEIVEKEYSKEEKLKIDARESSLIVTGYAQKYFTETLNKHQEGRAIGISYFKERGFTEKIIEKFQLGYCLDSKKEFTNTAIKSGYKLEFLTSTGLTVQKGDWTADRFSARVMFPIHNVSGKTIAFGGRTLKTDKKIAKYLNSPESDIYSKRKILYGIYFAKHEIIKKDSCYLVEGYTDVVSMHQAGIENVVASSGTALTVEQIRLIRRFTKNVTILYDGDNAGINASLKGIDLILKEGMNVKIVLFPDGEDPDSYSHKLSSSEYINFLDESKQDFITFKTQLLAKGAKNDPVKKAGLISSIVDSISVIDDEIQRSVYTKECSTLLDISEQVLFTEVNKRFKKSVQKNAQTDNFKTAKGNDNDAHAQMLQDQIEQEMGGAVTPKTESENWDRHFEIEESEIIKILLKHSNYDLFRLVDEETQEEKIITVAEFIVKDIKDDELEFQNPIYKQIFDIFNDVMAEGKIPSEKTFTHSSDEKIATFAANVLTENYELSKIHEQGGIHLETEEMKLKFIVPKLLVEFKQKIILTKIKEIQKKMKKLEHEKKYSEYDLLLQEFMVLSDFKIALSKQLGNRIILSKT